MNSRGKRVDGDRLRPVEDATTGRVPASELLVTDGPFTESKWIAGFDIVECDDSDKGDRDRLKASADAYRRALELVPTTAQRRLERRLLRSDSRRIP